jgi:hypothetical protein
MVPRCQGIPRMEHATCFLTKGKFVMDNGGATLCSGLWRIVRCSWTLQRVGQLDFALKPEEKKWVGDFST